MSTLTLSSFCRSTAKYLNSGSLAKAMFTQWTQRAKMKTKPRLESLLQLKQERSCIVFYSKIIKACNAINSKNKNNKKHDFIAINLKINIKSMYNL